MFGTTQPLDRLAASQEAGAPTVRGGASLGYIDLKKA
jgi:hypothetical protein